jgi:hypothetical protein
LSKPHSNNSSSKKPKVVDNAGDEKRRIRPADLMDYFDDLRRRDLMDETAAAMLANNY